MLFETQDHHYHEYLDEDIYIYIYKTIVRLLNDHVHKTL
jgi:hypothetical protein